MKASVNIFPLGCRKSVYNAAFVNFYSPLPFSPSWRKSLVISPCNNINKHISTYDFQVLGQ